MPIGEHGVINSGAVEVDAFDETDRYLADILSKTAAAALDRIDRESVLERLHAATRALMAAGDAEEVAKRVVATVRDILGYELAVVRLLDETDGALVPVAATDPVHDVTTDQLTYPVGEGSAGRAFARGEAMRFETQALEDDVDRRGVETTLCVPVGGHCVVTIAHSEPDAFDEPDVQLAKILASNAEAALDRVERERELTRQNERLDEFASVVSHDLRNPLNVAMSHAELLADDLATAEAVPDESHERVGHVETALDRMNAIVDDVLSLSRSGREVVDRRPLPLAAVVRTAWSTVAPPDGSLVLEGEETDMEAGLGLVACDRSRLLQVFENLFRNAAEHAGESATVWVGRTESGFYVEDDGPGIPESERSRVFESGYTTEAGGTGFGLAIVRRVVQAHSWQVGVTMGRTGGARFEVEGVETVDEAP